MCNEGPCIVPVVAPADDAAQCHAVGTAQRMVRHEGVEPPVVFLGEILLSLYLKCHLKIMHTFGEPFRAGKLAALPKKAVHLILMDDMLQPAHGKAGHVARLRAHFIT